MNEQEKTLVERREQMLAEREQSYRELDDSFDVLLGCVREVKETTEGGHCVGGWLLDGVQRNLDACRHRLETYSLRAVRYDELVYICDFLKRHIGSEK